MDIQEGFTLAVLGAGVMGCAFTSAILKAKVSPFPGKIYLLTKSETSASTLRAKYTENYIEVISDSQKKLDAVSKANVIILGCKPYHYKEVYEEYELYLQQQPLVLSMLAGITIEQLSIFSPYIARVMTNTPAQFGCGMATVAFSPQAESKYKDVVLKLADTLGTAMEIPEKNMDAATALVGSGPAFCLLMMEALYDGGVRMGLQHDVAKTAAAKVMEGTAKMVLETGDHPAVLKSKVCTPGGTTIGGLLKMEDAGVRGAISRAVEEAAVISASFAKK